MSASTAAKFNACTEPTNTRCGSQSELTSNARSNESDGALLAAISGKRPPGPAFKNEPERTKAPYDLGAFYERIAPRASFRPRRPGPPLPRPIESNCFSAVLADSAADGLSLFGFVEVHITWEGLAAVGADE
jgi:hypothetical protein